MDLLRLTKSLALTSFFLIFLPTVGLLGARFTSGDLFRWSFFFFIKYSMVLSLLLFPFFLLTGWFLLLRFIFRCAFGFTKG